MSDARIIMERMRGLIESMACASQMHVAAMSSFAMACNADNRIAIGLAHDLCISTLDAYLASVMAVSIGRKELPRC